MKIGLIGGLLLVPAGMYGQAKMESPNIVIIEADDLGFGDLSCYGATAIQTSGMDRLANEGLDAFVCQMDLLASLASLVGQSYPDRTDSQNTLQTFLGKNRKGRNELVIEGMLDYAYRQGDWVMIPPYPGENRTYELYNIRKDPEQKNDLSESEPKVLRRMMMRFEELKRETGKKTNF